MAKDHPRRRTRAEKDDFENNEVKGFPHSSPTSLPDKEFCEAVHELEKETTKKMENEK